MIGVDLVDLINDALKAENRAPDGLLHPSGDLIGSLRHTQLRLAGAPYKENPLVSAVRLKTGTFWHTWLGDSLERRGVPVMREVKMNSGLPEGWGGTADFFFWSTELNGFVLADLKTIKGEGIKWIHRDGAKDEHLWQLSAYYWAAVNLGMPIVDRVQVIYLPMNDVIKEEDPIEPTIQELVPLPYELVWGRMEERRQLVDNYLASLEALDDDERWDQIVGPGDVRDKAAFYLTPELAPPMERVQKLMKNKDQWDVVLVPHWSAMFCPFDDELCPCSTLGTTKVGTWSQEQLIADSMMYEWLYRPRKGYESYSPEVAPKGVKLA